MKIELKKIKYMASLSEETLCYSADIYVDGIKTAEAYNHGHGAPDEYRAYEGQKDRLASAEKWCSELPEVECSFNDPRDPSKKFMSKQDLETVCSEILQLFLAHKDFKKTLKKPYVLRDGSVFQWNCKPDDPRLVPVIVEQKAKGAIYLNEMNYDEAFALWHKQAVA